MSLNNFIANHSAAALPMSFSHRNIIFVIFNVAFAIMSPNENEFPDTTSLDMSDHWAAARNQKSMGWGGGAG